jgi:hypothetical protein
MEILLKKRDGLLLKTSRVWLGSSSWLLNYRSCRWSWCNSESRRIT